MSLVVRDVRFAVILYRREKIFAVTWTMIRTVLVVTLAAAVGYLPSVQFFRR